MITSVHTIQRGKYIFIIKKLDTEKEQAKVYKIHI